MSKVIGVSFRSSGKVYYFSPGTRDIARGEYVIVETARGVEIGKVAMSSRDMEEDKLTQPLKEIIRVATPEDKEKAALIRAREKTACSICKEKIRKHGLEMKLIDAEYTFDESKLLFYFTADGRVDFRELVKDLASEYRTRIELRQVGVRDETKILGGIGICGRVLCCHSYLSDFVPVSIKMAKEQNLSLNPSKISGSCGRLMCCLKYEEDVYEELNRHLPGVGDVIVTKDNMRGRVDAVDVLGQRVKLIVDKGDDKEMFEINASDIAMRISKGKKKKVGKYIPDATEEELKALEDMAASKSAKENGRKEKKLRDMEEARSPRSENGEREEAVGRRFGGEREETVGRRFGGDREEAVGRRFGGDREEARGRRSGGEREETGGRHDSDGERSPRGRNRDRSEGRRDRGGAGRERTEKNFDRGESRQDTRGEGRGDGREKQPRDKREHKGGGNRENRGRDGSRGKRRSSP